MEDNGMNEIATDTTERNSSAPIKTDADIIKEDIKNLVKHLKNLKDDAMESVMEEGEQLIESLAQIKDRMMHKSNRSARTASWYIQKHPMQSMLYSFATGILLTILLRK